MNLEIDPYKCKALAEIYKYERQRDHIGYLNIYRHNEGIYISRILFDLEYLHLL